MYMKDYRMSGICDPMDYGCSELPPNMWVFEYVEAGLLEERSAV